MAAAAQHATSSSVTGMAHQIEAGPSTAGSSTEASTAVVKYAFASAYRAAPLPRLALSRTLPPIPVSRPRL